MKRQQDKLQEEERLNKYMEKAALVEKRKARIENERKMQMARGIEKNHKERLEEIKRLKEEEAKEQARKIRQGI